MGLGMGLGAGAGMGVDSGLPDFRGDEGFWKAYPPMAKLGIRFSSMANPRWFESDPELAWGFYGHRLNLYRATVLDRPYRNTGRTKYRTCGPLGNIRKNQQIRIYRDSIQRNFKKCSEQGQRYDRTQSGGNSRSRENNNC